MLLLIFFLLTSSFVATEGLDVVLPEATNIDTQEESRLYVSIDKDQKIEVNGKDVTLETLPTEVRAELVQDSMQTVVIRADGELQLKNVIGVLDQVKGAGARKFFIATEKEK
jgi:biopolymer transport protein ExbD